MDGESHSSPRALLSTVLPPSTDRAIVLEDMSPRIGDFPLASPIARSCADPDRAATGPRRRFLTPARRDDRGWPGGHEQSLQPLLAPCQDRETGGVTGRGSEDRERPAAPLA